MIFSFPVTLISTDKIFFKQKPVQYPISFPPNKTTVPGNNRAGRNTIEIKIIPEKKKVENMKFLNIMLNVILIQKAFVFY